MSTTILSSRGESVVHPYPSFLSHLLSSSLLLRVLPVVPHGQDKFVQVEGGFACALDLVKHMRISSKLAEEKDRVKVKRKTVEAMLERCQRALESLGNADSLEDDGENFDYKDAREVKDDDRIRDGSSARDQEADEFCSLLKSRLDCPDFLEKLECARVSIQEKFAEECGSWDIVSENDIWEGENVDLNEEDYVLVRQEDIMDGIACFMAAYLLSLKQTKDLTPNQLQEALSKTFSVKTKKGKLRKAWDGSKVIYNVASWGATAIGIYQNPLLISVASKAFWTSCDIITKLV